MKPDRVAVLGAGLQGVCAALALRRRGFEVTLVDQAPDCMLRASLRNEGKIHLGFVYAKDASFRTPSLMLESSTRFADRMEAYVGGAIDWEALRSRPFVYVVARESMVEAGDLLEFYDRLQEAYLETRDGRGYLGRTPDRLWREIPARDLRGAVEPGFAETFVETAEAALDLVGFRDRVRSALHDFPEIETLYGHRVRTVARTAAGFRVEGERADGSAWSTDAGIVVNCLWDGRLEIDDRLGVAPNGRSWVHRFKYRLLGDVPEGLARLPSLTLVVGPYGDFGGADRDRTDDLLNAIPARGRASSEYHPLLGEERRTAYRIRCGRTGRYPVRSRTRNSHTPPARLAAQRSEAVSSISSSAHRNRAAGPAASSDPSDVPSCPIRSYLCCIQSWSTNPADPEM